MNHTECWVKIRMVHKILPASPRHWTHFPYHHVHMGNLEHISIVHLQWTGNDTRLMATPSWQWSPCLFFVGNLYCKKWNHFVNKLTRQNTTKERRINQTYFVFQPSHDPSIATSCPPWLHVIIVGIPFSQGISPYSIVVCTMLPLWFCINISSGLCKGKTGTCRIEFLQRWIVGI